MLFFGFPFLELEAQDSHECGVGARGWLYSMILSGCLHEDREHVSDSQEIVGIFAFEFSELGIVTPEARKLTFGSSSRGLNLNSQGFPRFPRFLT